MVVGMVCAGVSVADAQETFFGTFDTGLPKGVTCENMDGGAVDAAAYRTLPEGGTSWYWAKVAQLNGALVCPTRNADGTVRRSRIVFPAVKVADADAVVRWDARSMVEWLPESYRVMVRRAGSEDWREMARVEGEGYAWETRHFALGDYVGDEVEVAFESATEGGKGFMLAIDNVSIGTLTDVKCDFVNESAHYVTPEMDNRVVGRLRNFGVPGNLRQIRLEAADGTLISATDLPAQGWYGEMPISLDFRLKVDERLDYRVVVVGADGARNVLCEDYVCCSWYRKTLLFDRLTGTWCNNCPQMALEVARKERLYGDEAIVAELHVAGATNEPMACEDYWKHYEESVFSIPQLIYNHNCGTVNDKTTYEQSVERELYGPTVAKIAAQACVKDGRVLLKSASEFAEDAENAGDRYRVGYIMLKDIRVAGDKLYDQANAAPGASWEEYYFMPARIASDMMLHRNVVVEGSTGASGVAGSLPAKIVALEEMASQSAVALPSGCSREELTVVAMILDNEEGRVLNCCKAEWTDPWEEETVAFTLSPSNESQLKSLSGVVSLTFTETENLYIAKNEVRMTSSSGGTTSSTYILTMGDAPNVVKFNVATALKEAGRYEFVIPEGSLVDDDTNEPLPAVKFAYTVDPEQGGSGKWTLSPSLDKPLPQIEGTFTLTLLDYAMGGVVWGSTVRPCVVYLYKKGDDTGGRPLTTYAASCSGNKISFDVQPRLYEAGEYFINVSGFVSRLDESDIADINIPFTLTGGEAPVDPEDPKVPLDQTYTLEPANSTAVAELSGRIHITFPNVLSFADVGGFITIRSTTGVDLGPHNGNYIRMRGEGDNGGYIDLDAYKLKFTEKGIYTFYIPEHVFHVDDEAEVKYDKEYVDPFDFSYTVTGPDAVNAVDASPTAPDRVVSLDGRVVSHTNGIARGIYIIEGRKVVR